MMSILKLIKSFPVVAFAYGLSLILIALSVVTIYMGKVTESWPVTEGVVQGSYSTTMGESTANSGYRGDAEYLTVVVKRVRYRYAVDGKEFTAADTSEEALKASGGDKIAVYYDPDNPATSQLETGVDWHMVGMWLFFAGMTVFAGRLWYRFISRHLG